MSNSTRSGVATGTLWIVYQVIGSILPLGLAVALSPFPVIAVVLLLLSDRGLRSAAAFLAGWVIGVLVAVVVLISIAHLIELPDGANTNVIGGVLRIALGVLLFGLAVRKWHARPANDTPAVIPGWMSSLTTASPIRSFLTGMVLSAGSPKNIAITAAAGIAVVTGELSTTQLVWSIVIYVTIASLSVLVPVIAYAMFAERLRDRLRLFEEWLLQNNATLMSILLVVFGFVVIGEGIGSF